MTRIAEIKQRLAALPGDSDLWGVTRHRWGFELYRFDTDTVSGEALISVLQEFLGLSPRVGVESGATEEDASHLVVTLYEQIQARTPKKAERRGQKPDRRQSKRRTSDKAKARLRR